MKNETVETIIALQNRYPEKRSALIPALHVAQEELGYLPQEVQQEVADLFGLALNEVNAVVSFYDMFFSEPVGQHLIHICKNASCMLRGSDEIIERLCHRLQVKPGEMTSDGKYTIIPSECLGACDRAPMAIVGETVVGPINEVEQILQEAKKDG